jgi:hypothetical protein
MGAPIIRIGDLDINQDLSVQERMWTIQRAGWAAMGFIVVLALAGLFGRGPVSQVTVGGSQEGLQVEYERFGRYQSPTDIKMLVRPEREGLLSIWIDHSYLAQVEIQQIVPEPTTAALTDGGVRFEWHAATWEPARVTFYLLPHTRGRLSGAFRTSGNAGVRIRQFIYP